VCLPSEQLGRCIKHRVRSRARTQQHLQAEARTTIHSSPHIHQLHYSSHHGLFHPDTLQLVHSIDPDGLWTRSRPSSILHRPSDSRNQRQELHCYVSRLEHDTASSAECANEYVVAGRGPTSIPGKASFRRHCGASLRGQGERISIRWRFSLYSPRPS